MADASRATEVEVGDGPARHLHVVLTRGASESSVMTLPNYDHVLVVRHRNRRWEVAHNGVTRRMLDWLFSRERAVEHALEMAGELLAAPGHERVLVRVEASDGYERVLESERASSARRFELRSVA